MGPERLTALARLAGETAAAAAPAAVAEGLARLGAEATGAAGVAVLRCGAGTRGGWLLAASAGAVPDLPPARAAELGRGDRGRHKGRLAVPLKVGEKLLGALVAFWRPGRAGPAGALETLDLLAAHGALALENALERERLAATRGRGLDALAELPRHRGWEIETPALIGRLSATVARLVGARQVAFWLLGPGGKMSLVPGSFGVEAELDRAPRGVGVMEIPWTAGEEVLGVLVASEPTSTGGFSEEDEWVLHVAATAAALVWQERRAAKRALALEREESAREHAHADRLAALEQAKTQFLNLAAHELRTPLAILRGYLSLLEDRTISNWEHLHRVLPLLAQRARQMDDLVTRMLETARLDEERFELSLERLDLRDIVEETAGPLRGASPRHRIVLRGEAEAVAVRGDRMRVGTVLSNLLDNAVKYSPRGGTVECRVRRRGQTAVVEVSDEGVGIAPQDLGRLFTRFGRIVTEETRHIPGTGLGLYLCHEIARRHGGDLTARSRPGGGSVFTLTLPLAEEARSAHRRSRTSAA